MNFDPANAILLYIVFLYSTVCHEAAHAWVAYKLGDDTAYRAGQVSLDPIPHIKRAPLGMLALPLIMLLMSGGQRLMGWGLAPYDPDWARRNPVKHAWFALAGPLANILLVIISGIVIRICLAQGIFVMPRLENFTSFVEAAQGAGPGMQAFAKTVGTVFGLNILLATLNLIPLPPLDGSRLPFFFLRGNAAASYEEFIRNPSIAFVTMLVVFNGLGPVISHAFAFAFRLLYF